MLKYSMNKTQQQAHHQIWLRAPTATQCPQKDPTPNGQVQSMLDWPSVR